MEPAVETIYKRLYKLTRPKLLAFGKQEGVAVNATFTKKRLAEFIAQTLYEREIEKKQELLVAKEKEEALAAPAQVIPIEETNLSPMKKPASYAILLRHPHIYKVLDEKLYPDRGVIVVVTDRGQKWEFDRP